MEAINQIGGIIVEKYIKPCLVAQSNVKGIVPLAAVGAMSAAQLAGVATVAGLAYGMAKGSNDIVSFRSHYILQEA